MKNLFRTKRAIINTLMQEPIEIVDSKVHVTEELEGLVHPTKIEFGSHDARVLARQIIKKLDKL